MPSSTTLFSSNRRVQRTRPLGGLEQARAISLAPFRRQKFAQSPASPVACGSTQQPLGGALALPYQRFELFAFLTAQPHNILLYRNLLGRHDYLRPSRPDGIESQKNMFFQLNLKRATSDNRRSGRAWLGVL